MHEQGISILSRPTNIITILNIGLHDDKNKQAMIECRNAIIDTISSINNYLGRVRQQHFE